MEVQTEPPPQPALNSEESNGGYWLSQRRGGQFASSVQACSARAAVRPRLAQDLAHPRSRRTVQC